MCPSTPAYSSPLPSSPLPYTSQHPHTTPPKYSSTYNSALPSPLHHVHLTPPPHPPHTYATPTPHPTHLKPLRKGSNHQFHSSLAESVLKRSMKSHFQPVPRHVQQRYLTSFNRGSSVARQLSIKEIGLRPRKLKSNVKICHRYCGEFALLSTFLV